MKSAIDRASRNVVVTIGNVTVISKAPTRAEVDQNIKKGQLGLRRAVKRLLKPGVNLGPRGTPIYYADPFNPEHLVRETNGSKETGRLTANGRFVLIK